MMGELPSDLLKQRGSNPPFPSTRQQPIILIKAGKDAINNAMDESLAI